MLMEQLNFTFENDSVYMSMDINSIIACIDIIYVVYNIYDNSMYTCHSKKTFTESHFYDDNITQMHSCMLEIPTVVMAKNLGVLARLCRHIWDSCHTSVFCQHAQMLL